MPKPLSQELADYLLSLARGSWSKDYNRKCIALWRSQYGDLIAEEVQQIVKAKWKG